MAKEENRTDTSIMQIKLAFLGAIRNLYLLENKLIAIENIALPQYSNYLSQVALCVELGLKSIISNTDDFERTHELETLFNKTPKVFQQKFISQWNDNETFKSHMSKMKNIFIDFRYMNFNSTLNEYLDKSVINSDNTINIQKAIHLSTFLFLRLLLHEILQYEEFMREETVKQMQDIDCTDADTTIAQYTRLLRDNQPNVVLSIRTTQ